MTLFESNDDFVSDPNKNYLEDLVGDGKKFATPEDLARAKIESDNFIERLKTETAGLRQELATRMKLEEAVEKIAKTGVTPPPSNEQTPPVREEGNGAAATPEDLRKLMKEVLGEESAKTVRQRNLDAVEEAGRAAFGPGFQRTFKERAQKLGLGESFLQNLAAEQPQAFLKLLDVTPSTEAPSTSQLPPRTSVSPEAFQGFKPGNTVKRQSDFEKIRKTDPSRYWSPAVQNEMHREAQKQGEAFFDL